MEGLFRTFGGLFLALVPLGMSLLGRVAWTQEEPIPHRWFYASHNLLVDENVRELIGIMERAAAVGYNGLLLADFKFNILDRMDDHYFQNVAQVQEAARRLGLEIVPAVFPIGYSEGILAHNPNLAAGVPVRGAEFVVREGVAVLDPAPVDLENGDFEAYRGHRLEGWGFHDAPGEITFIDTATVKSGRASLRMENIRRYSPEHGNARVSQEMELIPFRQYRLSFWIKTEGFDRPDRVRATLLTEDGRNLTPVDLRVRETQDWTLQNVVFNSLNYDRARLYLGVWGGNVGKLWLDGVRIEEIGPLHILRREGCPLTVVGEDGTVYEEGRDFEPLKDPQLAEIGYHEPPVLRLTESSRIAEGERLRVSYYHSLHIYWGQVPCSLNHPEVFRILEDQARRVQALFSPRAFWMSHDEIRIAGWDELERRSGKTPGQLLAENVRRCVEILRSVNPEARIYVWSDMFDPYHNATERTNYYLVNGSWAGSWEGLPPEVIVANWYFQRRRENMPFFAQRGHRQLLAGYYDGDPSRIALWIADARELNVPLDGVMYTTWRRNYTDLEAFAQAAWGKRP
ncbi:MAG: hypothetical protein KatS3mg115_1231 [Candidatus Poribacteria bacterium]|nr:MAG: hypothetical protein KatS3mg115_1231 [Candidatus Poribacteria bacterium]